MNQITLQDKSVEDIKPNRWITLTEQKSFCEFLSSLGINTEKIEWCASKWEKYQCSKHPSHAKKIRYISCSCRGICPRCSMAYASQRASLMYQWVKQNIADRLDFDLKLNQIVLTLPKILHDIELKLFSKMIKKFMKRVSLEAYGYSIQTRHSKDPLNDRYVHCHILSLNMKSGNNRIVESQYYFDVDKLRRYWKKIIEEDTGVKVEGDVNLHTEYTSILHDKKRVLHLFSYLYRYPIEDLFNVQVRTQSLNYVQCSQFEKIDNVRAKVMELIDEDKPRIVWCGLLTSTKRHELIKLILNANSLLSLDDVPKYVVQIDVLEKPGFKWKNLAELEKEMRKRVKECRDCGSPYEEQPIESGLYDSDNEPELFNHHRM